LGFDGEKLLGAHLGIVNRRAMSKRLPAFQLATSRIAETTSAALDDYS
jgi:hypothetical protein